MIAYAVIWVYVFTLPWQNLVEIPGVGTLNRTVAQLAVAVTVMTVLMRGRFRPQITPEDPALVSAIEAQLPS